jgi:hypothetical protein
LCGSTPTTLPARSGVINTLDGPGPRFLALLIDLTSSGYVVGGPADNIPVDALHWGERSYQVRPILEGKNRGRHFVRKTPSPESIAFGAISSHKQEREPSRERRPQRNEMPDRTAPIERNQPRIARRIVVGDRVMQRLALDLNVLLEELLRIVAVVLRPVPVR